MGLALSSRIAEALSDGSLAASQQTADTVMIALQMLGSLVSFLSSLLLILDLKSADASEPSLLERHVQCTTFWDLPFDMRAEIVGRARGSGFLDTFGKLPLELTNKILQLVISKHPSAPKVTILANVCTTWRRILARGVLPHGHFYNHNIKPLVFLVRSRSVFRVEKLLLARGIYLPQERQFLIKIQWTSAVDFDFQNNPAACRNRRQDSLL